MRVYLDNCCFNRPFDDQRQIRVFLETQAKLHIQEQIKNEKIELAVSFVSRYENSENPDDVSGGSIADFFQRATIYVGAEMRGSVTKVVFFGLWVILSHLQTMLAHIRLKLLKRHITYVL